MAYTVNDFFCGCGGMGIGFKNAGFDVIWACDYDKYAVKSYKENVGDHVIQADIKDLSQRDIPKANVWAFGFPCQDLSVAGKQRGFLLKCDDCGQEFNVKSIGQKNVVCPACGSSHKKTEPEATTFMCAKQSVLVGGYARGEDIGY